MLGCGTTFRKRPNEIYAIIQLPPQATKAGFGQGFSFPASASDSYPLPFLPLLSSAVAYKGHFWACACDQMPLFLYTHSLRRGEGWRTFFQIMPLIKVTEECLNCFSRILIRTLEVISIIFWNSWNVPFFTSWENNLVSSKSDFHRIVLQ